MQILNSGLDLDGFFASLQSARERVLLVDYDGTLAPFHPRPDRAFPYPHVASLVNAIHGRGASRVVLVTGRTLADSRMPLAHIRASEVWAAHGWQRAVPGGRCVDYTPAAAQREHLDAAERAARELEPFGAKVERKPGSLAVHWRGLDPMGTDAVLARLRADWPVHEQHGLEVLEFDDGIELRSRARTKAHAVQEALAESAPDAVCAYLGDDRTDEDAFAAIRPRGIGVLVRTSFRRTGADLWLEPPRDLVAFLKRWRDCARIA